MGNYLRTADNALRDYLRTNISDPMGRSENWIFCSDIKKRAGTPRVYIRRAGSIPELTAVGSLHQFHRIIYEIIITFGAGDSVTPSEGTTYKMVDGLNYIADLVTDQLETGASSVGNPIHHIIADDAGGVDFNSDESYYFTVLRYIAFVTRYT